MSSGVDVPLEYQVQAVLLLLFPLAFLVLAAWSLRRVGAGRWAVLSAVGSVLLAVTFGLTSTAGAESIFLDDTQIYETVLFHRYVATVLVAVQALGAALLVLAFMDSRRVPAPRESVYGSPTG